MTVSDRSSAKSIENALVLCPDQTCTACCYDTPACIRMPEVCKTIYKLLQRNQAQQMAGACRRSCGWTQHTWVRALPPPALAAASKPAATSIILRNPAICYGADTQGAACALSARSHCSGS